MDHDPLDPQLGAADLLLHGDQALAHLGGREDVSLQVHLCLLALRAGRPVKMVYSREESFFGHVHRHPAVMHYEFGAEPDGTLVYARSHVLLDGGAYASSTSAVVGNAGTLGLGFAGAELVPATGDLPCPSRVP